ncbi:MAG: alkaline phosphatase family protein [Nevskia sp.]|nr:alkaline phosphatase family protein [Nevskia sp.]
MQSHIKIFRRTRIATAIAGTLALCSTSAFASVSIVKGVVGGAYFTPPVFADTAAASSGASMVASVYAGARVCFDLNGNGACDAGEPRTTTASDGSFQLSSSTLAPLVAEISTSATNNGNPIASRNVFRVHPTQISASTVNPLLPATVYVTPLSTEVALAIENQGLSYTQAAANLAQRIGVSSADVLKAPTKITNSAELPAVLKESVIAQGRLELAAKFVDRGDTVGELRGNFDCPAVASFDPTNADACTGSDLNTVAIPAAQEWAYNLEGMPQYDYVFVIIEENESLSSVKGAAGIPYINAFLNAGSQFYNYFSTSAPSEPNYLALGGADDWGQTSDEGIPYPAITGVRANLFNEFDAKGLSWHIYEESLWPSPAGSQSNPGAAKWNTATGGVWFDNPAESSIKGSDGSTYPSGIRAVKHHPAVWYADAAAQPDFLSNNRSIAGTGTDVNGNAIPYAFGSTRYGSVPTATGDWDAALQTYATTNNITSWWSGNTQPWVIDQFKQDLQTGNVANYNFIVPDQDDDMHNTGVTSRSDYFFANAVAKIESSALWNDPTKRVAIVVTFDEGEASGTPLACCGWNPARGGAKAAPVAVSANGTVSTAPAVSGTEAYNGAAYSSTYANGNKGHGVTMFGLLTNQQVLGNAPHGNYDTDYYSHFSFVRTLQDIFGLSDPGQPGTYANRSKYTENFIEQNAALLPEFTGSANPHFDGVRAMNHVYQFPAGVTRVSGQGGVTPPVTTGPDASQVNLWAVHN